MQHVLTPLAIQLRSVLADLSTSTFAARAGILHSNGLRPARTRQSPAIGHAYHQASSAKAAVSTAAPGGAWYDDVNWKPSRGLRERQHEVLRSKGTKRLKRRRRRDYLTEALRAAGRDDVAPRERPYKTDLSHQDAKRRGGWRIERANRRRHALDNIPPLAKTKDLRLDRLVASCIQQDMSVADIGQAEWASTFQLDRAETAFLTQRGYVVEDVRTLAQIITMPDAYFAFTWLANQTALPGSKPVPFFVLLYLLRRPWLNARALRIAIQLSRRLLSRRREDGSSPPLPENALFILFSRLVRHAREVWPAAIEYIADFLLHSLPKLASEDVPNAPRLLERLTHTLNKAMHLISIETAIEPLKDIDYQEAGIVQILRFMASHAPSIQLNREGYRAVVRIQLAQKKTLAERQWAELKALSWPPWKQERTAMDANVTPEYGVTRASDTLRRMREAGYGTRNWEKAAQLFAGWDTDGTPTIQTRTLLGSRSESLRSGTAVWAARILTTRTAQEAWAAYLAFEDAELPSSQDVHLAIIRKLFAEEKRQRHSNVNGDRRVTEVVNEERLLPGDTQEVEALPPSTHLYTYTRTPVPTVEGFVRHLHSRHVSLIGWDLAFAVANSTSLQLGFWYLRTSSHADPATRHLRNLTSLSQLANLPEPLLAAVIQLLCRYTNVPLSRVPGPHILHSHEAVLLDKKRLNTEHPLVLAIILAQKSRTTHRPTWNAILRALHNDATLESMRFVLADDDPTYVAVGTDYEIKYAAGAIMAYRLVRRVLSIHQGMHMDLDAAGFQCLCLATENTAIACWKILDAEVRGLANKGGREVVREVHQLLRSGHHVKRLTGSFKILVGDESATGRPGPEDTGALALPSLLHAPSVALLHAYIRALGWMGDHEGILETLRWMVWCRSELEMQRLRDRNARSMMRKVIVAIRVFLERSWLDGEELATVQTDGLPVSDEALTMRESNLRKLEAAAPRELVAEAEELVKSVPDWRGWATAEEVARYCQDGKFQQIRSIAQ